ncbi:hypothetical protein ENBRE01_3223 [Enteropsectra breve]|nr:hypothetical protein ENBRE01_2770 [Enteropsectra breve]KAI5152447.1 hypothetical protein ENBRE01_2838 [Enteropsectra breve]KAI5152456.1 hypothetical protein ENBRE01_2843 [Enteropsectra breve]KAI5153035.1 hypothetical protein ENBRE01_3099 [Enteropsectra breve]KAI5153688.1 hypothetical protein ENBRE01_3223 [Enteropsectra breve]
MIRKSYTVKEKLKAIKKLKEERGNISKVARELEITNKMLRDWRNNEDKLLQSSAKHTLRSIGSGRRMLYQEIEAKLLAWVYDERNAHKRIISFEILRRKALSFATELHITSFKASNNWIVLFMKRNRLSSRKITSIGQEDHRPPGQIKSTVLNYFENLSHQLSNVNSANNIINMDETPVYIDMMSSRTISFKGEKNTEAHSTGHNKTRITVVLSITAEGHILKTLVILKGLKKTPKCRIPRNLIVTTSKSGTMNKEIMQLYIRTCLNQSGPFQNRDARLLLMDEFASHKDDAVKDTLVNQRTVPVYIPPRTTSFLQPLDVLINSIFKASLKQQWAEWSRSGPNELTKLGYRKRPSWECILNFISKGIESISEANVKKCFIMSGLSEMQVCLDAEKINEKLVSVLQFSEGNTSDIPIDNISDENEHEESDSNYSFSSSTFN